MVEKPIFRPSFGNRPDQLVGRSQALTNLIEGVQSYPGSQDRATFLLGQRGMGKTALLLEVADQAADYGYVCARATCGPTMLGDIIDQLQHVGAQYVQDKQKPIKGFSAGALGFSFGLTFNEETQNSVGFKTKLEMICNRLAEVDKGVLLLIDETTPTEENMRTLATAYQELAGEEKNIAIIMAGLPSAVSEVLSTKTLTFLSRARRISLEAVPIPEVKAYYRTAFERAGRMLDEELLERASKVSRGIPYMLQLMGYYLVAFSNDETPVTIDQFEQAKEAAREEFDTKVFQAILKELSSGDIAFLCAMAQDADVTRVGDLEDRLGITQGTVQTYRRRLLEAGVIEVPRRGEVRFIFPEMAEYLNRE